MSRSTPRRPESPPPRQTAYGLPIQGYAIWKLRHALSWQNVALFIAVNHKNLGTFGPELLLAKACTSDLVVVQTTKEVHHE